VSAFRARRTAAPDHPARSAPSRISPRSPGAQAPAPHPSPLPSASQHCRFGICSARRIPRSSDPHGLDSRPPLLSTADHGHTHAPPQGQGLGTDPHRRRVAEKPVPVNTRPWLFFSVQVTTGPPDAGKRTREQVYAMLQYPSVRKLRGACAPCPRKISRVCCVQVLLDGAMEVNSTPSPFAPPPSLHSPSGSGRHPRISAWDPHAVRAIVFSGFPDAEILPARRYVRDPPENDVIRR